MTGVLVGNFEKNPSKVPESLLVGVAQINFHPKEVPGVLLEKPMDNLFDTSEKLEIKISGNAHSSCHVLLNTLKGTAITLPEVILYYSTLSGTN